jgi:hypothetical protein
MFARSTNPAHVTAIPTLACVVLLVCALQAWRILVPDPNVQIPERSKDDVRDPPGAHRARILEPGSFYD